MFSNSGSATHKERWLPESMSLLNKQQQQQLDKTTTTTTNTIIHNSPLPLGLPPFPSKKKLGLASLTVLIFYEVSGGPFGIEVCCCCCCDY